MRIYFDSKVFYFVHILSWPNAFAFGHLQEHKLFKNSKGIAFMFNYLF